MLFFLGNFYSVVAILSAKILLENVLEVLGAVDTEVFSRLLRQIIDKNVAGAIGTLDELDFENDILVGNIYHNLGTAYARLFLFEEAIKA